MICKSSKSAANVYGAMHLNPYLGDKLEVRYTVSDTSPCEVGEFSLMKFRFQDVTGFTAVTPSVANLINILRS